MQPPVESRRTKHSSRPRGNTICEIFRDFDLDNFLVKGNPEDCEWIGNPLTEAMIAEAEAETGYTLSASYLQLLRMQNGSATSGFVGEGTMHYPTDPSLNKRTPFVPRDLQKASFTSPDEFVRVERPK